MASTGLRREEGIGLVIAVALHAAVLAALLVRPPHRAVVMPPQRIEVTISDEAALTSTSPDPFSAAAPDAGPEAGDPAPPPEAAPAPSPLPVQPQPRAIEPPRPEPRPVATTAPRVIPREPVARPTSSPKPVQAKPLPKPVATHAPAPQRRASAIDSIVARPAPARAPGKAATPAPARNAVSTPRKAGSSAFADAFKDGLPGAKAPTGTGKPAATVGPAERVSLAQAVLRQVKPVWQGRVPEGVNTDKIVTVLSIELNPDGTLAKRPVVLSQSGIDDSNRAQAERHAEEAIRAVQLAAPFKLPPELYEGWKKLPPLRFRKSMS